MPTQPDPLADLFVRLLIGRDYANPDDADLQAKRLADAFF
jgi:hypothetical protein